MKNIVVLLLFLLSYGVLAEKSKMEGYIYSYMGHDFITEKLGTTSPHYKINWASENEAQSLCKSEKPGECPRYAIRYTKAKDANGRTLLKDVVRVSPF